MTNSINKPIENFIKEVKSKYKNYFIAYGLKKYRNKYAINIIIDDRDIIKMEKSDLRSRINKTFLSFAKKVKNSVKAKTIFLTDLTDSDIWNKLGDMAVIYDVEAIITFIIIKYPKEVIVAYKRLPNRFKLSDFVKEIRKLSNRKYSKVLFQKWLKAMMKQGFLKLNKKTYYKIEGKYKNSLLESLNS